LLISNGEELDNGLSVWKLVIREAPESVPAGRSAAAQSPAPSRKFRALAFGAVAIGIVLVTGTSVGCHPEVDIPSLGCDPSKLVTEVRRLGEVTFNGRNRQPAADWIRDHPARFARLTAARIEGFGFPWYPLPIKRAVVAILTLCGCACATLLFWEASIAAIAPWAIQPAVHLVTPFGQSATRYEYPIDRIGPLAAVYTMSRFARAQAEDSAETRRQAP
jgi:hypothetical protein